MKEFDDITDAYVSNMFSRNGETVDVLSLYKALPDKGITSDNSENLYHIAAKYADFEAIELLAEEGIKPRPDDNDNTPLHSLAQSPLTNNISNFEKKADAIYNTAKKLIELKVNPKKKNQFGQIAYYEAGKKNMYPFIQALADAGIKMDAVGEEGKNYCIQYALNYTIQKTEKASLMPLIKQ